MTHNVRISTQGLIDLKKLIAVYTEQEKKPLNQQQVLDTLLQSALQSMGVN